MDFARIRVVQYGMCHLVTPCLNIKFYVFLNHTYFVQLSLKNMFSLYFFTDVYENPNDNDDDLHKR